MTVPVDKGLSLQARRRITDLLEKISEHHRLPPKALSVFIVRHDISHLIPENGAATWFHTYDRSACGNLGPQHPNDLLQIPLGLVQEAVVVERPAATKRLGRNFDAVTSGLEDFHRQLSPCVEKNGC